jgi:hypothetical protein
VNPDDFRQHVKSEFPVRYGPRQQVTQQSPVDDQELHEMVLP